MFRLPVSLPVLMGALALAAAFAAGWSINGLRWSERHETDLRKMYEAGVKAYQNRDERAKEELHAYGEELRGRYARGPVRRVYLCPDVPAAAGGTDGSSEGGGDPLPRFDAGAVLGEARDSLLRCRALIRFINSGETDR